MLINLMLQKFQEFYNAIKVKPMEVGLTILLLTSILYTMTQTVTEPDLWGRIKFGNDVLMLHNPHLVDHYNYVVKNVHWVDIEWLSGVILALAYNIAKTPGLLAVKFIIVSLILINIYHNLRNAKFSVLVSILLLSLVVDLISVGTFVIRAHLFTYLFLGLLISVILNYRYINKRYLFAIPLIFIFWVNLHGGFIAGLALYGLFVISEILCIKLSNDYNNQLAENQQKITILVLTLVLALGVTLFNPWGFVLLKTIFVPDTLGRPEIPEWAPLNILSLNGLFYFVLLFLAIFSFLKSKLKIYLPEFLIFLILSIVPLIALRHLPLYGVSVVSLISLHLYSAIKQSFLKNLNGFNLVQLNTQYFFFVCSILLAVMINFQICKNAFILKYNDMPYGAMKLLQNTNTKGNLVVYFNWGEYIIYHLGSMIKVSMDPRRELVYPRNIYNDNIRFTLGVFDWDDILDKYDTNMVLVPKNIAAYNLMKLKSGYECVYDDSLSALFVKQDFKWLVDLKNAAKKCLSLSTAKTEKEHNFP